MNTYPILRTLLVVALFLPCQSCTTILLWSWAGSSDSDGQLLGVVHDHDRGDLVLYGFNEDDATTVHGLRVPRDWPLLPIHVLASTSRGSALTLSVPLLLDPFAADGYPDPDLESLPLLDYQLTIETYELEAAPHRPLYGIVELLDPNARLVHELHGFDPQRRRWIRLAVVDLGPYGPRSGRVVAGIALTPLAVAADLVIIGLIVCAASGSGGGGSLDGLDFSGLGGRGPSPRTMAEREEFWHRLRTDQLPGH